MSLSTKPYLLRALYEWCTDSGHTPYIAVWVNAHTRVPAQYVENGEIVLNIGPNAAKNLHIDNEWVSFSARFAGVAQDIWIPVGHVRGIFARETGEGMGFEVEPYGENETDGIQADSAPAPQTAARPDGAAGQKPKKKILKLGK
ncbi:ClpXP protease specificity-enhancing factor [Neisseria leonii]|uniref:ClpXP protease specificity-enhancing factor n=1 Tax=Neisseria leonii TaxID=2995413 RepID=UPI00237A7489|nr:ClpXP protease specificity-enhancing factor [Neisseria sp. 3986]MDD9326663.1 ClpXP protease specificity-enhancing factor [Neisseria sp. 3986]